jgi:uncharacterized membrane protein YphA (DoxX/SURF4 family)
MTAARLLIGAIFLASGVGKLLEPAGQFAHILGAYRLVPQAVIPYVATWLPWGELILGTYLVSGFETRWSALVSAGFFAIFSAALATNLVLGIPLEECGCFGVFLKKEGAVATLVGDLLLLGISLWLVRRPVSRASLDGWLEAKGW